VGDFVDGDVDGAVEEASDADHLLLADKTAISGDARFGASLRILHCERDRAAAENTLHLVVDVLDGELATAADQLSGGRTARRRQWDLEADHHRLVRRERAAGERQ